MIPCPSDEQLRHWLEGGLDEAADQALADHVDTCARCQQILDQLTTVGPRPASLPRKGAEEQPGNEKSPTQNDLRPMRSLFSDTALYDGPGAVPQENTSPVPLRRPCPRVAGYEVLEELGRGAMGVVYLARQLRLNRRVALKMILAGDQASPEQEVRFAVEAETVARLLHPNIVQIYEIGSHNGRPYLALEYVAGGDLAEKLAGRPLPPREGAVLVEALARAIHHAHERGIVHRDLKPANVLLTPDGAPKIADFGLARLLHVDLSLTASGAVAGTPSYVAPEQLQGGAAIGPATDVYALGAILFEALTGRPPFVGTTPAAVLRDLAEREPVPPSRLAAGVPRDLETICLKCLEKAPARRYATALALAGDCAAFLGGEPITARRAGSLERAVKWARRRPAVAGLLAAVVLVTVVGFGLVFWQWRRAEANALAEAGARSNEEEARQLAQAETKKALTQLERQQVAAYAFQMTVAQGELRRGNPARAEALLAGAPRDLRGWEHGCLQSLCMQQLRSLGEAQTVYALAFNPNRTLLAVAEYGGRIRIWDPGTGEERHCFQAHESGIYALAFSPDGRRLASGGSDVLVKVWEMPAGHRVPVRAGAPGHGPGVGPVAPRLALTLRQPKPLLVLSLAFRPDGQALAAATADAQKNVGEVLLWDLAAGGARRVLQEPGGGVLGVCFDPAGRRLASCGQNLRVWDSTSGQALGTIKGNSAALKVVVFSPDGRHLAFGGCDRTVRVCETEGKEVFRAEHQAGVLGLGFSPDGQRLILGSEAYVKVWDLRSGREIHTLDTPRRDIACAAVSPDGSLVAVAGKEQRVRVLNPNPAVEVRELQATTVTALAFGSSGLLTTCEYAGKVKQWSPDTGHGLRDVANLGYSAGLVAFRPDGQRLAAVEPNGAVGIWDLSRGGRVGRLEAPRSLIRVLAYHPNGQILATAGENGSVLVWDLAGGPQPWLGPRWARQAGQARRSLEGAKGTLLSLAFSPDGSRLAAGGKGPLCVWDVTTGQLLLSLSGHSGYVRGLAFSADGSQLASCGDNGLLRLHDADGKELWTLTGHSGWIGSVAFHPEGNRLASCGEDRTLRLWDPRTGQEVLSLLDRAVVADRVIFSPDGQRLAASCKDGTVRIWSTVPPR